MSRESNPTRSRILATTRAQLEAAGATTVRMSDIAKAANISRQALYLHFDNRAELLVATVRYLDEVHDVETRLAPSRSATSGVERLEAWVEAWGSYIPEIHGVAKALLAMRDSDEAAKAAWDDRMAAMRDGCAAVVAALARDRALTTDMTEQEATDLLWTLLSVQSWEHLCIDCGWTRDRYIAMMQNTAIQALVARH